MPENPGFPDDLLCRGCFYRSRCTDAAAPLCAADLLLPPVPEDECCGCRKQTERMYPLYGLHFCRDCYDRLTESLKEKRTHP